jgi:hypothetical protein
MMLYLLPLAALCVADVLTTNFILKRGGREMNPLVNMLAKSLPLPLVQWGMKGVLLGAAALINVKEAYICFIVIQGLAVIWNANQIRKKK